MGLTEHWGGAAAAVLVASLVYAIKRATWGRHVAERCTRCGTPDYDTLPARVRWIREATWALPTLLGATFAFVPDLPAGFGAHGLGARLVYFALAGTLSQKIYDRVRRRLSGADPGEVDGQSTREGGS